MFKLLPVPIHYYCENPIYIFLIQSHSIHLSADFYLTITDVVIQQT
jgi:hypothetical protein